MIPTLFAVLTLVAVAVFAQHMSAAELRSGRTHLRRRSQSKASSRAERLGNLEETTSAAVNSADAMARRLRPQLRFIVIATLQRRGMDLDTDPRAEELLGPVAWALLRAGTAPQADSDSPGLTDHEVRALTEMLERIR